MPSSLADPATWVPLTAAALVSVLLLSAVTSLHILLGKREPAAAVAWTAIVWMSPVLGPLAYLLLGINRVQRKAMRLLGQAPPLELPSRGEYSPELDLAREHLLPVSLGVHRITGEPLVLGNRVTPLRNGDETFPAMLEAIETSERSLTFLAYILDNDHTGNGFVDALIAAHRRGVEVRVLVDGIGARRAWNPVRRLREAGVACEIFLWSWAPWKMALINLRNHRKLLVVDGVVAFTGGINIRDMYRHVGGPGDGCDLHFRVEGPIVHGLQQQFAVDWAFTAREALEGEAWYPELPEAGDTPARVIPDGPDEDVRKIARTLFQAISASRESIRIATPYFLPPAPLGEALRAAAERGVDVRVVVPETNLPRWFNRATLADVYELIEAGVKLGFKQGPFEHTKLTVIDRTWVLLGSYNWDARSLRLNFELALECYDPDLASACMDKLDHPFDDMRWVELEELQRRSSVQRVADAALRLFKPWL